MGNPAGPLLCAGIGGQVLAKPLIPFATPLLRLDLESIKQPELKHTPIKECAGDLAEISGIDKLIANKPCGMVEDVRSLDSEFQRLALLELGDLAQCHVHVEHPR